MSDELCREWPFIWCLGETIDPVKKKHSKVKDVIHCGSDLLIFPFVSQWVVNKEIGDHDVLCAKLEITTFRVLLQHFVR